MAMVAVIGADALTAISSCSGSPTMSLALSGPLALISAAGGGCPGEDSTANTANGEACQIFLNRGDDPIRLAESSEIVTRSVTPTPRQLVGHLSGRLAGNIVGDIRDTSGY